MNTSLAIIVIAIILVLLYIRAKTEKEIFETLTSAFVENDTLILVHGNYELIKKILHDFTQQLNDKSINIRPRLVEYANHRTYILFPYAIEFEQLCFLHNYLVYPKNISANLDVSTWYTSKTKTNWVHEKMLHTKLQLYLSEGELSYDHVYAITENNDSFKIDFAGGVSEMEPSDRGYGAPIIDFEILKNMPFEDLK